MTYHTNYMIRGYRFNTIIFMDAVGFPEDHEMYGFGSYIRDPKKSEFECIQFQNYIDDAPTDCLDKESCDERGCCYCYWVHFPVYYTNCVVEIDEQNLKEMKDLLNDDSKEDESTRKNIISEICLKYGIDYNDKILSPFGTFIDFDESN